MIIQNRALSLARFLGSSIITSTDKMAASSRFATVSEDDFVLNFFFLFFEIITCVFILKQLFGEGKLTIGEYSPIITSPLANNC